MTLVLDRPRTSAATMASIIAERADYRTLVDAAGTSAQQSEDAYRQYSACDQRMLAAGCRTRADAAAAIAVALEEFEAFYGTAGACGGDDLMIGLLTGVRDYLKSEA